MCSFICTTKPFNSLSNTKSKLRGPDHTQKCRVGIYNIIHNLLDISLATAIQPKIKDDKILLYNGEIYDPYSLVDTELILPLYEERGHGFVNYINGEYAIAIFDKEDIFLYSDVFGTKPLFYSIEKTDIGISTYSSELYNLGFSRVRRVEPSTYIHININEGIFKVHRHSEFDLTEFKSTYQDCIQSFENACKMRCTNRAAIGVSSGHDSGSILQWCLNNSVGSFYFIDTGKEDADVMDYRREKCIEKKLIYKEINYYKNKEPYDFYEKSILSKTMERYEKYKDETSTFMISKLLRKVKSDGFNIFISGQGGDEIVSNYVESGIFFKDLKAQFPWKNFYSGDNRLFIDQFEYIGGVYGVEVRYPFLDRRFVQEFLNLTLDLKNKFYKSVISEYLQQNNMPAKEQKVGFSME